MKSLKIVVLADCLDEQYAGVRQYLHQLLIALSNITQPHQWILLRTREEPAYPPFPSIIVPKKSFPASQAYRYFYQLPQKAKSLQPDMVIEPAHFGPFRLPPSIKRVTIMHDLTPIHFPQWHHWHSAQLQKLFLPQILNKADLVLTNSLFTESDLLENYPQVNGKTFPVIPGRPAELHPIIDSKVLHHYKITTPYILYLGTIEPRKDLPTLIKAFNQLKSDISIPHQLVLAGKKGWKYEATMQAINNSPYKNDIILTGYLEKDHIPALMSQASIFVYPSLFEGFGLPVLEAMCTGTPVITTSVSSLPEVGGDAALYFTPGDYLALSQKLQLLLKNPQLMHELSQKGQERCQQFDWDQSAKKLIRRLEKMWKCVNV